MQRLSIFLMFGGFLLIGIYIIYQLIYHLYSLPLTIRIGLTMVVSGLLLGLIKVILDRLKGGNEDDVDRKY